MPTNSFDKCAAMETIWGILKPWFLTFKVLVPRALRNKQHNPPKTVLKVAFEGWAP